MREEHSASFYTQTLTYKIPNRLWPISVTFVNGGASFSGPHLRLCVSRILSLHSSSSSKVNLLSLCWPSDARLQDRTTWDRPRVMQCISVGVYNELFLKTISCFPVSFHFSSSSQCIVVLASLPSCAVHKIIWEETKRWYYRI